jgi:hypothetical protein
MNDYCAGPDLEDLGIRPEPVRAMWSDFSRGEKLRADLLWQMFALVAWSRQVRGAPAPVPAGSIS